MKRKGKPQNSWPRCRAVIRYRWCSSPTGRRCCCRGAATGRRRGRLCARLRPAPTTTNLAEGLAVAEGLIGRARRGDIYLFTDAAFAVGALRPPAGVGLHIVPSGAGSSDNQAVETVHARRDAAGTVEAFIRVRNYGDSPVTQEVLVFGNDELLEGQTVQLNPGAAWETVMTGFPAGTERIEVRLDQPDLLPLDDVGVALVEATRPCAGCCSSARRAMRWSACCARCRK